MQRYKSKMDVFVLQYELKITKITLTIKQAISENSQKKHNSSSTILHDYGLWPGEFERNAQRLVGRILQAMGLWSGELHAFGTRMSLVERSYTPMGCDQANLHEENKDWLTKFNKTLTWSLANLTNLKHIDRGRGQRAQPF